MNVGSLGWERDGEGTATGEDIWIATLVYHVGIGDRGVELSMASDKTVFVRDGVDVTDSVTLSGSINHIPPEPKTGLLVAAGVRHSQACGREPVRAVKHAYDQRRLLLPV